MANWTLDKCYGSDGFRVRQALDVHCGLLTPPSGAQRWLATTFNCHFDLEVMGNPRVIMELVMLLLNLG